MKKLVIALILIATIVGGYRFLSSRQKGKEEKPVEKLESEITATPTPKTFKLPKSPEEKDKNLPSAGLSTEEKPRLSEEELERMIQEFESEE